MSDNIKKLLERLPKMSLKEFKGQYRVLEKNLRGWSIETKGNDEGANILHKACECGNLDVAKFLVAKGFDINSTDERGWSVVHYAVKNSRINIIKELENFGADLRLKDDKHMTPLMYASKFGDKEILEFLIDGDRGDRMAVTDDNWKAIHYATESGMEISAKLLLDKRSSLLTEKTLKKELTPLHIASDCGNKNMVKLLLEYGDNPHCEDIDGRTPLFYAVIKYNEKKKN